jgi:hypothetical protein
LEWRRHGADRPGMGAVAAHIDLGCRHRQTDRLCMPPSPAGSTLRVAGTGQIDLEWRRHRPDRLGMPPSPDRSTRNSAATGRIDLAWRRHGADRLGMVPPPADRLGTVPSFRREPESSRVPQPGACRIIEFMPRPDTLGITKEVSERSALGIQKITGPRPKARPHVFRGVPENTYPDHLLVLLSKFLPPSRRPPLKAVNNLHPSLPSPLYTRLPQIRKRPTYN